MNILARKETEHIDQYKSVDNHIMKESPRKAEMFTKSAELVPLRRPIAEDLILASWSTNGLCKGQFAAKLTSRYIGQYIVKRCVSSIIFSISDDNARDDWSKKFFQEVERMLWELHTGQGRRRDGRRQVTSEPQGEDWWPVPIFHFRGVTGVDRFRKDFRFQLAEELGHGHNGERDISTSLLSDLPILNTRSWKFCHNSEHRHDRQQAQAFEDVVFTDTETQLATRNLSLIHRKLYWRF
uniref:Uncharacterized protein n=1 Tax=Glossina pallidipes TaxID=7398 RepID=A0A1A9ZJX6_GLOPL